MRRSDERSFTLQQVRAVQKVVRAHFKKHGRDLPWRETTDPYKILVSEVMLQQTQVERVIPKYKEFLKLFPTVQKLANASLGDVLRVWSGLGYNRRAKMLWECAREIVEKQKGTFPNSFDALKKLRGVGPYTAGAISAFAFNQPIVMIETNIRSVYLHHFFKDREGVHDAELLPLIEQTLDRKNPRLWYNMLMDYGSYLKAIHGNPNRKSKHHTLQKPFKGSNREKRGTILRALGRSGCTLEALARDTLYSKKDLSMLLEALAREGLIVYQRGIWKLP